MNKWKWEDKSEKLKTKEDETWNPRTGTLTDMFVNRQKQHLSRVLETRASRLYLTHRLGTIAPQPLDTLLWHFCGTLICDIFVRHSCSQQQHCTSQTRWTREPLEAAQPLAPCGILEPFELWNRWNPWSQRDPLWNARINRRGFA